MASIPERSGDKLKAELESLQLLEASELVKQIEEAFGVSAVTPVSSESLFDYKKELLGKFTALRDAGFLIKEIDNIFVELTSIDNRILQSQLGIDNLKTETREMLATLGESIV
jgi:hypothetical protein